jgi:hypothetical protein
MADIEPCLRRGEPRRSKKVAMAGLGIEDYGARCRSKEFVYHAANGGFETANSGAPTIAFGRRLPVAGHPPSLCVVVHRLH